MPTTARSKKYFVLSKFFMESKQMKAEFIISMTSHLSTLAWFLEKVLINVYDHLCNSTYFLTRPSTNPLAVTKKRSLIFTVYTSASSICHYVFLYQCKPHLVSLPSLLHRKLHVHCINFIDNKACSPYLGFFSSSFSVRFLPFRLLTANIAWVAPCVVQYLRLH